MVNADDSGGCQQLQRLRALLQTRPALRRLSRAKLGQASAKDRRPQPLSAPHCFEVPSPSPSQLKSALPLSAQPSHEDDELAKVQFAAREACSAVVAHKHQCTGMPLFSCLVTC